MMKYCINVIIIITVLLPRHKTVPILETDYSVELVIHFARTSVALVITSHVPDVIHYALEPTHPRDTYVLRSKSYGENLQTTAMIGAQGS